MYAQIEKSKESENRAVANSVAQKNSNVEQGFGFVDNRPEAIAQRTLQGKIYSTTINDQDENPLPSVNSAPIIQRAVGYEFETGWIVRREISLNNYVPMKKKEPIGFSKFDGFKMEADEAGGGEGEIEFIVHPPIEEGESGFKKLDGIMDGMEMLGSVLEAKKEPFTFNEITMNPQDKMFQIHPHKDGLKAGPQVTSGLDLAKIRDLKAINDRLDPKSKLYELLYEQGDAQAPEELRGSISSLSNTAEEISLKTGEISQELNGLLVVMSNYLEIGGDKKKGQEIDTYTFWLLALSYPKIIADRLLARTNFAKLFKLIPEMEQKLYKENPKKFVALVEGILPDYVSVKDSIIARGVKNHEEDHSKGITIPKLTIEEWLLKLLKGTDLIPTDIEDAESLGEMGEKVEAVGEEGRLFSEKRDVGIFEFRGAQTNKIPFKRWKPFALEFQQYISTVHRD